MSSVINSSDLLNYYSDMYSQGAETNTSKLQNTLENTDYSKANSEQLLQVCKDFEQYLVEQVMKEMKKMVPESSLTSSNKYLDYFGDTYTRQLAQTVVESNEGKGIGIAQMLYEQMKRNYGID